MSVEAARFREVLGHFPTGVCVVTAIGEDGSPAGMAIGSFTSVSLNPPLVGFLPAKASSSFPRIRAAKSFCVNVLSAGQEDLCRVFATSGADKFADVGWSDAPSGAPVLDGVLAWIDCAWESVHETGDHYLALGRVTALDAVADHPLVFFRGGYGRWEKQTALPHKEFP
ncbi:flavin reductase family protein [Amycolatopsis acidicola]|uniref:Flavin reductase family protein n=1 Tax=Amycolatopsis acidicola TaxID=2596893 RepID=A0A5N0UVA0_9PSEU|nr:flavin reductase family protein [Amycolatopsis acidicola]KAA9156746.1 flavin reductase family protein [Amycolatopsis acidicola]